MPELPEVETVVRGLLRRLPPRRVAAVILSRTDIVYGEPVPLCEVLCGRRIRGIRRLGKQIHMDTDGGYRLVVHLGMTGRLLMVRSSAPVARHTHLRVTFEHSRWEMRFVDSRRFGGIWIVSGSSMSGGVGRPLPPAGPDALRVALEDFRGMLDRPRQIKALLLDQRGLSGIGNIYCDESLHRAGIHPRTRACDLSAAQVVRLYRAIRRTLAAAIRAGGSSISDYRDVDDAPGFFQLRHRVYGRRGQPCRRCRTPICRLLVAGRSTFLCPRCQRQVRPVVPGRRARISRASAGMK